MVTIAPGLGLGSRVCFDIDAGGLAVNIKAEADCAPPDGGDEDSNSEDSDDDSGSGDDDSDSEDSGDGDDSDST